MRESYMEPLALVLKLAVLPPVGRPGRNNRNHDHADEGEDRAGLLCGICPGYSANGDAEADEHGNNLTPSTHGEQRTERTRRMSEWGDVLAALYPVSSSEIRPPASDAGWLALTSVGSMSMDLQGILGCP
jgi:hypothetical protein